VFADGFTLLAPSDDAFNQLDEEMLNKLLTDKKFASETLRMHLLRGTPHTTPFHSMLEKNKMS
jgi:uncharacterized surface protein with fasciclin (FAS1) repeats